MATYRERREARAERLREWGERRVTDGDAMRESAREMVAMIPFGQPVHGQADRRRREKSFDRYGRAIEHGAKGEAMMARAEEIDRQAANAIYSDDPDATERLAEKIAGLEAERERIKAYNASCRKAAKTGGVGDTSLLDERQRQGLATLARVCSYQIGRGGSLPAYELANLSGNISRLRKRLADLESGGPERRAASERLITARYGGACADCGAAIERGQMIRYSRAAGARCADCGGEQ